MTDEPRFRPDDEPQQAPDAYEPPTAEDVSADEPAVIASGGFVGS